jgi:hypothetical protein
MDEEIESNAEQDIDATHHLNAEKLESGYKYAFAQTRHLLRDVSGSMSAEIVADREDRF